MHERYYVELAKQEKLLSRKNEKSTKHNMHNSINFDNCNTRRIMLWLL